MKTRSLRSLTALLLCAAFLLTAVVFCSCGDKADDAPVAGGNPTAAATELGEGEHYFTLTVKDGDGKETVFNIHTDEETVGAALTAHDLISGEDGQFGLFVKTVNGITADYDIDGTYWAFYADGEMSMTGVDSTYIVDGTPYMFCVEK